MIPSSLTESACPACKALCAAPCDPVPSKPHSKLKLEFGRDPIAIYSCHDCGAGLVFNRQAERCWQWGAAPAAAGDKLARWISPGPNG